MCKGNTYSNLIQQYGSKELNKGKKKVKGKDESNFKNKILQPHRNRDHKLCVMRRRKSTSTAKKEVTNTKWEQRIQGTQAVTRKMTER